MVHLDGTSLPHEVYQQCDVMTLSAQLGEALERQGLGEYDGDEQGPTETTLFMYGSDADQLFRGIEAVLRAYPLCSNARVVIRHGLPGAPEREVRAGRGTAAREPAAIAEHAAPADQRSRCSR